MSKRDDNTPPEYTQDEIPQTDNEYPQDNKVVDFPQKYNGERRPVNLDLTKDWDYISKETKKAGSNNKKFQEYNKEIAVIDEGGKLKFVKISITTSPDTPNIITKKFVYPTLKELEVAGKSKPIPVLECGKLKFKPVDQVWLQYPDKKTLKREVFLPEPNMYITEDTTINMAENRILNLYHGMSVRPRPGNCAPILNHLLKIICKKNFKVYNYLLNWFARLVQYPHLLGETAIIIKGGQGSGKNVIVDMFVKIFAVHSVVVGSAAELTPKFNSHYDTAVLVVGNEISAKDGKPINSGEWKAFVTQQEARSEKKYHNAEMVKRCPSIVITTNSDNIIEMDSDDRRVVLIEASNEMQGNFEHFSALFKHIYEDGGMEAFLDMLLKRDISNFNTRDIPYTHSMTELETKIRGSQSFVQWVYAFTSQKHLIIESKDAKDAQYLELLPGWDEGRQTRITTRDAYDTYVAFCRENKIEGLTKTVFDNGLRKFLGPYGLKHYSRTQVETRGNERKAAWEIPCIEECQRALELKINKGNPIPWES